MKISDTQILTALQGLKGTKTAEPVPTARRGAEPVTDEFVKSLAKAIEQEVGQPAAARSTALQYKEEAVTSEDIANKLLGRSLVDKLA